MDHFLRTVLPKRLSLVTKVRIGVNFETPVLGPASFTRGQTRKMLRDMHDKLTGLKELRFEDGFRGF